MAIAPTPKFGARKTVETEKPRTEAEYLARSAENISRGSKGKTGRPAAAIPVKNVSISLPIPILDALDALAAERTGANRSLALVGVLEGRFKLQV